ncbi:Hpt domain-containing protein, partial [Nitrospirales bacterium NOB]|nr:Hpt domain-containing protein [Nitrospirales bacterium NOB]
MNNGPTEQNEGTSIVRIDPDLQAIVPGFLDNRRRDVVTIEHCLRTKDLETIRLLGHRMKGDGGGYGFPLISAIGHRLEQAALRQDLVALE